MHEKEPAFDSLNRKALFIQGHREPGPLSCSSVGDLSALVEGHLIRPESDRAPG